MIILQPLDYRFACEKCKNGHRIKKCVHYDRPLHEIKAKGRPVSQCSHCRSKRRNKVGHNHHRCMCGVYALSRRALRATYSMGITLVFDPDRTDTAELETRVRDSENRLYLSVIDDKPKKSKTKSGREGSCCSSEASCERECCKVEDVGSSTSPKRTTCKKEGACCKKESSSSNEQRETLIDLRLVDITVVEESSNDEVIQFMSNPCSCAFGGVCICSNLSIAQYKRAVESGGGKQGGCGGCAGSCGGSCCKPAESPMGAQGNGKSSCCGGA